ncbi:murein L,D-transpeptidase catalytic domain family protein [Arundinibacter roseus]|uniref:Murein L,D-transpeptidase catalytic domain family protein n=1 Tax=Arundinibacter roseus TaxID=2070510 RepID=A0A4R4KN74_9BACT|nr:murein L,D-transpeptidase catalytic domain family protein [Arundinibacter roseus]TDB68179.1 murein L,D-transpeptidase catalytic domain family protein [Arundinibacter roseus]
MKRTTILFVFGTILAGLLAGFQRNGSSFINEKSLEKTTSISNIDSVGESAQALESACQALYDSLHLQSIGLSKDAFRQAWFGFQQEKFSRPILAIVDFSQSSRNKRLYIVDFEAKKLVLNTYVAHGRNSGNEFAQKFSNENSSYQSSLGFYRALDVYQGKHGLSLKLQGLEKNINDRALERAIVLHGADYVSESFIRQTGRLGRSLGCPAVSYADHKVVIETLRNGAGMFLYYPDDSYVALSKLLQKASNVSQGFAAATSFASSK